MSHCYENRFEMSRWLESFVRYHFYNYKQNSQLSKKPAARFLCNQHVKSPLIHAPLQTNEEEGEGEESGAELCSNYQIFYETIVAVESHSVIAFCIQYRVYMSPKCNIKYTQFFCKSFFRFHLLVHP